MIYNAEIIAGLIKEVSKVYENNAGLNINRDIKRLKEFAKAMERGSMRVAKWIRNNEIKKGA